MALGNYMLCYAVRPCRKNGVRLALLLLHGPDQPETIVLLYLDCGWMDLGYTG
jgi:hypothetical protein